MRRAVLLPFVLAALGCSHSRKPSAEEALTSELSPEPIVACMNDVLGNSSFVERVTVSKIRDHPRRRYVALRNPPGTRQTGLGFSIEPSSGPPRELVVEFAWPGPWQGVGGMQPPIDPHVSDGEGENLADISTGLLRAVRARCAPAAPGEPACSRVAQGKGERCVLGL